MTGMHAGYAALQNKLQLLPPAKVLDLELTDGLHDVAGLERYRSAYALIRHARVPIGALSLPIRDGICHAEDIGSSVFDELSKQLFISHVRNHLELGIQPTGISLDDLTRTAVVPPTKDPPRITVAVCTKDRPGELYNCLQSLTALDYSNADLLVIDNAPSSDETRDLVRTLSSKVSYIREPKPGLNWARNCALAAAHSDLVAFTDDDAIADRHWLSAIARAFAENPGVAVVTGLIAPLELETPAQILFENIGGFGRGYVRKLYLPSPAADAHPFHLAAGIFGAGANMAFRKSIFAELGPFDPALDVGTPTQGGGDLEMFFRALEAGHPLLYDPSAIIWHRHRRTREGVADQIASWGTAVSAFLVRSFLAFPRHRWQIIRFGIRWLLKGHLAPTIVSCLWPSVVSPRLLASALSRSVAGLGAYHRSMKQMAKLQGLPFSPAQTVAPTSRCRTSVEPRSRPLERQLPKALRAVDLAAPLCPTIPAEGYTSAHITVTLREKLVGVVQLPTTASVISRQALLDQIATLFGMRLLAGSSEYSDGLLWPRISTALQQRYLPSTTPRPTDTPKRFRLRASIVVATLDRPDRLRRCLESVTRTAQGFPYELVVVDNNPESSLTKPVVASFPNAVLISEPRRGLAYARNAGILASRGDVIVTTDDDVVVTSGWLAALLAPFERADVGAVTGNTLPMELDTEAQNLFESYGGLGRGCERFEVGRGWFGQQGCHPAPIWRLGATANAAFRRSVIDEDGVGLMDEALGPGTPTGVGEDIYLMYKILKQGYTICYAPDAHLLHEHRRTMPSLRRQLFAYSRGLVAYHMTTLFRDGDLRALTGLLWDLPRWHASRLIFGQSASYPPSLVAIEVLGNLLGPAAFALSQLRVQYHGRAIPSKGRHE